MRARRTSPIRQTAVGSVVLVILAAGVGCNSSSTDPTIAGATTPPPSIVEKIDTKPDTRTEVQVDPPPAKEIRRYLQTTKFAFLPINQLGASRDRRLVIAATNGGTAYIWEVDTGKLVQTLSGHRSRALGAAISPDGRLAATGGVDNTLRIWDVASGQSLAVMEKPHGMRGVGHLAFSADGQRLLSCGGDRFLRLWDVSTWQPVTLAGHESLIGDAALSPDGKRAISAGFDHTLRLWDLDTGKELHKLLNQNHASVAFSPDGRYVLCGGNNSIVLWDMTTAQLLKTYVTTSRANSLAFNGDGSQFVSVGMLPDNVIRHWDVASGRLLHVTPVMPGYNHHLSSVIFLDNNHFISGSAGGLVQLWSLNDQ